jgi:glycosyltransferase involved in cell wall biosynthesis
MQDPKSILCVGNEWFPVSPGGQERYVYELTRQLASGGDVVTLCAFDIQDTDDNTPVKLINLGESSSKLWKRMQTAGNIFRATQVNERFKAINFHFSLYAVPLLLQLSDDIPTTLTFHGPWSLESQQEGANGLSVLIKSWIESWVYKRCNRFIVLSKAFGTILHETYRVPWHKIHVIPGGVDISHFQCNLSRSEARAKLDWPCDRPILFTPRRLVHRMGLDKLISALIQVKQQIPNVWLAIAGRGPLREMLEQKVRDYNLEENVIFLGYLPDKDLPVAYQAADLTVIPSQSLEGFGLVLLESLASGTPVLCTPVGGMPEIVEPFDSALIADSTEESAIAERLNDFLNGSLELPCREACREYAVRNFGWEAISSQVRSVLLQPKV